MIELKNMSKDELNDELRKTNKRLASVVFSVRESKLGLLEKSLWHRKRKILAKLNPINKLV